MALIDQRILIDAPIAVVWEHLADPDKLARWHVGYTSISILTTHRAGVGVRRRCMVADGGKDIIEEITAWMDNIGYEYTIAEGGPYRTFQARMRLQAVPDGIMVQWTIDYASKGLIGAIMDRLTGRRKLTAMMAGSLRQLKRTVDQLGVRLDDTHRERVGIQGRLNADERAEYQRRHAPPPGIDPIGASPQAESPVQPMPAGQTPPESIPAAGVAPSFVADLIQSEADYSHTADTQPRKPEGLDEAISEQSAEPGTNHGTAYSIEHPPKTESTAPTQPTPPTPSIPPIPPPPEHIAPPRPAVKRVDSEPTSPELQRHDQPDDDHTPPRGVPRVQPIFKQPETPPESHQPPPTPVHAMPPVINPDEIPTGEKIDAQTGLERYKRPVEFPLHTPPVDQPARDGLPPQTPKTDTGEISIWEVFGMPRPSEQDTQSLEELVQTVRAREAAEKRRKRGFSKPRRIRVRVRRYMTVEGLRRQLVWRVVRVRCRKSKS